MGLLDRGVPEDIQAAYDELVRQGPDRVLRDLTDVKAVLKSFDAAPKRLNRIR